jgi:hypothetical protein
MCAENTRTDPLVRRRMQVSAGKQQGPSYWCPTCRKFTQVYDPTACAPQQAAAAVATPSTPIASSAPPVYPGMAPVLHAQKKEEEQADTADKEKDKDADELDLRTDVMPVTWASPALPTGGGGGAGRAGASCHGGSLPTPSQMVEKLDRYVVGQARAKKVRASPRLLPRATTTTQSNGEARGR